MTTISDKQIQESIQIAKQLQKPRSSSGANPFAERMAPILNFPESKHFLIRLMDVAFRSHNYDRISVYVLRLFNSTNAHKPLFSSTESILVRLFRIIGYKLPSVSVPLMLDQIQQVTSPVVFFKGSKRFVEHYKKRNKHGVKLNINPLGETLIGEEEADKRIKKYIQLLNEEEINYMSVKLSTLNSQILPIAHEQVVEDCVQKLARLYNEVERIKKEKGVTKFINLDMEEYRDLRITIDTFKRTLSLPEFKKMRAGIVLQAYLPDSYDAALELREWAKNRVKQRGAPVKVRIVKGANLEMEKTTAELQDWELTTYNEKLDTDANFKKILVSLLEAEHVKCLNVGVASHNIFDLAFSLRIVEEQNIKEFVDFEMLEGMAKSTAIEINRRGANLLLYTPVVTKSEYNNAIAYLVRRLDEGTQDGNFLKEGFNLEVGSDKWATLEKLFIESVKRIDTVKSAPNRTQNRGSENKLGIQESFHNVADTDWILPQNRDWLLGIRERWIDERNCPISEIPVVNITESTTRNTIKQDNWKGTLPWDYHLASQEDYDAFLKPNNEWAEIPDREKVNLLRKAAVVIAENRADLIGVAVAELGKIAAEVDVEVSEAVDFANFYAESLEKILDKEYLFSCEGVQLVLSPWNFPIAIPIGGVLASLAAGKRVILKPSQNAAACAYLVSKCLWEAGIPKSAFAFLPTEESNLDKYLSKGRIFDAVILTGGTATAKFLLERNPQLELSAETGGKNATIVTALSDREQAIANVVQSAFGNSGQKCSATSLLILEKEVYEDPHFKELLRDTTQSKTFGDPWDFSTQIGPLAVPINENMRHVLNTTKEEDWLLKPVLTDDFMLSPGIKWGVKKGDFEYENELFGPILSVMKAKGLGDAIELVNGVEYGLTSGIESLAREEVRYWKDNVFAGNLYANRSTTGAIVLRQPFGGMKASSYGFGMKAGGINYVKQFMNIEKDDTLSVDTVALNYENIFQTHFNNEKDYAKIRGQHNICRYLKPRIVHVIVDKTTTERDLDLVIAACKAIKVQRKVYSTDKSLKIEKHKINFVSNLNKIKITDPLTRVRVLAKEIPDEFKKSCHNKAIHLYDRKPHTIGEVELLNYLTEQSLSLNYHRYGNLMGEEPML